jgi:hypothetical protein
MSRLVNTTFLVLLSVMTVACSRENAPVEPPIESEQQQALIPFNILSNGKISGVSVEKPTLFVLDDEDNFKEFWARHATVNPAPEVPAVDFKTQTLFAIIDSDQPNGGYYLSFDKIERVGDELWLYVTREQPSTECVNMGMIAQPYVMVAVDKTTIKAKLIFQTKHYPC